MTPQGPKVLFIMGWGRSGSTILDTLLGELDGFFSTGELHNLWRRGLMAGHTCGCGLAVTECEVWSAVLSVAHRTSSGESIGPAQVVKWQREAARTKHTPRLLRVAPGHLQSWPALGSYTELLGRVYSELGRATGARVLIDSSKRPAHGAVLRLVPGIDPYVVHLVRDPRAVAYSRRRGKSGLDRDLRPTGALESTSGWVVRNLASEAVSRRYGPGRSLLVRYEEFVGQPLATIRSIARLVDERADAPSFNDHSSTLGLNHTVAGNPSRFIRGTITLKEDDAWIAHQSRADRLEATALALPLLHRYGYSMRPAARVGEG